MDDLKPSDVLARAADLIEPAGAWTQGTWARSDEGEPVYGGDSPVCWCVLGAIWEIEEQTECHAAASVAEDYLRKCLQGSASVWNDDEARTQTEVIAALREAAELARRSGQ